ncbi:MAG TPA: sulfatase [Candidatus Sulfotelmatobacter sp.]|nr:sulfatase [Candidatus Sulfotelmatobacter sp.]
MKERAGAALAGTFVMAACVVFAHAWAPDAHAAAARAPNIVFVLTDDLSWNLVQYMPNVLAMQREGTTFSNYFVTDSLCCPSRSSIFTGKFPHTTGVYTNNQRDGGYAAFLSHGNEPLTFAVALQRGGYRTAMLGKYLNGYFPRRHGVPPGWGEWAVAGNAYPEFNYVLNQNGRIVPHGDTPQDYLTDVLAELADGFVRQAARGPFFIEVATFAPHAPYIPAPRDAQKFPGLAAPRTAAFGARPDAEAPRWLKEIPALAPRAVANIDKHFRMRAQSVLAVDAMVGRLRATLAGLGVERDTVVVFSSDNGLHMGEYSMRPGKMTPFDIDIRVPLIVVGPGVAKGRAVDEIAENVDLAPTFTELAGASAPTAPDGRSLVPLFQGGAVPDWRRMALVEHRRPFPDPTDPDAPLLHAENPPSYEAVRTAKAMYVEYKTGEVGYYELGADPEELRNVASRRPAAARQRWHEVLRANRECAGAEACWNAQRLITE